MSTITSPIVMTPEEVERAGKRDAKIYELIDGELKEKSVGARSLFIATRLSERLNAAFYPTVGFAAVEVMIYCFKKKRHGRKPDVLFVKLDRLEKREIPDGDLYISPDLAVEVLSPGNAGLELDEKLNEYLEAGIPLVWIVNADRRTVRVYRNDGTTRLFHAGDVIENEPLLPGFRLLIGDIFPAEPDRAR